LPSIASVSGRGADSLFRLLWLSIAAAVATITLKTVAWLLTGSVGLQRDGLA
jgi:divalent metal cation (Fe/Co/Zn/Cd) transporter